MPVSYEKNFAVFVVDVC